MHTESVSFPHLDILDSLFLSVVPEVVVDPLSDELQRRLGPKCVLGRHVEVVHEGQKLLATQRDIHAYTDDKTQSMYVLDTTVLQFSSPFVRFSTLPSMIS